MKSPTFLFWTLLLVFTSSNFWTCWGWIIAPSRSSLVKISSGLVPQEPDDPFQSQDDIKAGRYDLGMGKNRPVGREDGDDCTVESEAENVTHRWIAQDPVELKMPEISLSDAAGAVLAASNSAIPLANSTTSFNSPQSSGDTAFSADLEEDENTKGEFVSTRKMVARDEASQKFRGALWDEEHYNRAQEDERRSSDFAATEATVEESPNGIRRPRIFYPNIDMSIPSGVYNESYDAMWELLRWEAYEEAQREPLLTSYLWSTILNHHSMETSLAFLLANRLSSPMLISTQLQSFILEALEASPDFRRAVRADMLAVRDRDPACSTLVDVYLYFKGFQALQAHRVAHWMWKKDKTVLAHYLQSAVSNQMQIDIHPNATLGKGLMLDHGTGIVVGETAMIGNNCSILHHVTLGGSGKKGVDRHPKVQDGVLLGAGATVLGNVVIGEGSQVGAGTLVISDLPPHCVAVGVPAKIIGSFIDVTEQPSNDMNQMIGDNLKIATFESFGI